MENRSSRKLIVTGLMFSAVLAVFAASSPSGEVGSWLRLAGVVAYTVALLVVGWRLLPALRAGSQPPTHAKDHPQRRLTDADADDLRHIIQELFPRDRAWEVACVHDDPEACIFARELRTFMAEQGFDLGSRGVVRVIFERPAIGLGLERRAGGYRLIVGRNPEPDEKLSLSREGVTGLAGSRRSGDMHWPNWWRILPPIRLRRRVPRGPSIERQDDGLPSQENEVVIAARQTSKAA